jgi:hypothetical protein
MSQENVEIVRATWRQRVGGHQPRSSCWHGVKTVGGPVSVTVGQS